MRRAASAAPPPGPMGPLPPPPRRHPSRMAPSSGLRVRPLPPLQPRRGPHPALRGPRPESPPRGSARIPLLQVSAPRPVPGVPAPQLGEFPCSGSLPAEPGLGSRLASFRLRSPLRSSARSSLPQAPRLSAYPARGTRSSWVRSTPPRLAVAPARAGGSALPVPAGAPSAVEPRSRRCCPRVAPARAAPAAL